MHDTGKSNNIHTLSFNTVVLQQYGGAFQVWGDTNSKLTLTNCTLRDNTAIDEGGAIDSIGTAIHATNCSFIDNTAGNRGGAISILEAVSNFQDCTFQCNKALVGSGGAIFQLGIGKLTIHGATFSGNTAQSFGGALALWDTDSDIKESLIENNEVTSVFFGQGGGGINYYAAIVGTAHTMSETSFRKNSAPGSSDDILDDSVQPITIGCGAGSGNCFCDADPPGPVISTNNPDSTCSGAGIGAVDNCCPTSPPFVDQCSSVPVPLAGSITAPIDKKMIIENIMKKVQSKQLKKRETR